MPKKFVNRKATSTAADMTLVAMCRLAKVFASAGLIASCGGGGDSGTVPVSQALPPAPAAPPANSTAALALFGAASFHSYMTAVPIMSFQTVGVAPPAWGSSKCAAGGSSQASLDGASPPPASLPTGTHTYAVNFANCLIDPIDWPTLNGTETAVYTTTAWNAFTAQVSTSSMRATGGGGSFDDISASGSAMWKSMRTLKTGSVTYTPAAGSTLVNNFTTHMLTFQGGSYASEYDYSTATSTYRQTFSNLAISLNGVNYVLDGTLPSAGAGEVRITSNGVLVARIYMDSQQIRAEALAPLEVF